MNWKLKFVITIIMLAGALTCAAFAAVSPSYGELTAIAESGKNVTDTVSESTPEDGFVISDHDGYIAIFTAGDTETPITVTDIEVSTLRECDRMLLERGVEISSREELLMLLEDFGS